MVMTQFSSYIPSILALGTLLVVAIVVTAARPRLEPELRATPRFAIVIGLTILGQLGHFIEEWRSGLHVSLPEAFGVPPISESVFVWFNVSWLVVWVLALLGARAGWVIALVPLWFLGLAMILNVIAHPLLSLRAGGYFPGLLTSPLVGVLGLLTIRELLKVTTPHDR